MPRSSFRTLGLTVLGAVLVMGSTVGSAAAQATRTWVSGVGDDANPCSRTAPCKTFAGTISKTAAGGEINVLDPGGFGGVTITKSISIESDSVMAGVLVSGANAIIVNAGPNDVIRLRGLTIEGLGTGLNGIRFLAGGTLDVADCTINNFVQKGISFEPSGTSRLFVRNTTISRVADPTNGGGILVKPAAGQTVSGLIDGVTITQPLFGIRAEDGTTLTIRNTKIAAATANGILASNTAGSVGLMVDDSSISGGTGGAGLGAIKANGAGAVIAVSRSTLVSNSYAGLLAVSGGQIISFANNVIEGNTPNGAATTIGTLK